MSVRMRQFVDRLIFEAFVDAALDRGYRLSVSLERGYDVDDMKDNGVLGSSDKAKIVAEAFAGDECHLFLHKAEGEVISGDNRLNDVGWVYFVWGNDGTDCISDYTCNPETQRCVEKTTPISEAFDADGPFVPLPEKVLAPNLYAAVQMAERELRGFSPFLVDRAGPELQCVLASLQTILKAAG